MPKTRTFKSSEPHGLRSSGAGAVGDAPAAKEETVKTPVKAKAKTAEVVPEEVAAPVEVVEAVDTQPEEAVEEEAVEADSDTDTDDDPSDFMDEITEDDADKE